MNVLIVDVGGSSVKLWRPDGQHRKFESGGDLTAAEMVARARECAADWSYDVVALGVPCRVVAGRPADEPHNLGAGWVGFDFAAAFERPVRILNDADLQALGSYRGGRMLFLGLGTSVGSTLIAEQVLISLELGQILHTSGEEVSHLLGKENRKRLGTARWQQLVLEIVPRLKGALLADEVVIGGGQAKYLDRLPDTARLGGNDAVVTGGLRLWQDLPDPADQTPAWRIV